MGGEPGIDAGGVEAVGAARQHTELVSLRERRQADGALLLSCPSFHQVIQIRRRRDGDGGQRLDGRLLQSPGWLGGRPAARAVATARCRHSSSSSSSSSSAAGAPGDERKAGHADEGAEEGRQDDHRVGVH